MKLHHALFIVALALVAGCNESPYLVGVSFNANGATREVEGAFTLDEVDELNLAVHEFPRQLVIPAGVGVLVAPTLVFADVPPESVARVQNQDEDQIIFEFGYADGPDDAPVEVVNDDPDVLDVVKVTPTGEDGSARHRFVFFGKREGVAELEVSTPVTKGLAHYAVHVIWQ